MTAFDLPIEELRRRASLKWQAHVGDVLPLDIAEMDMHGCPDVRDRLVKTIVTGDTGYAGRVPQLIDSFCRFAADTWQWAVSPHLVAVTPGTEPGFSRLLSNVCGAGDVIVTPPTYEFPTWIAAQGLGVRPVALLATPHGWSLDLEAIRRAFGSGCRALVICQPNNPTGTLFPAADLAHVAILAERAGAVIFVDELHAPLADPHSYQPFLSISPACRRVGISLQGPGKAWNISGLKCSLVVTGLAQDAMAELQVVAPWQTGHLGVVASQAAYESAPAWLPYIRSEIAQKLMTLSDLMATNLPDAVLHTPAAGYLAWVDFSAYQLSAPAAFFLERAGVALSAGTQYSEHATTFARINFATSDEVLTSAVTRMAAALAQR